MDIQKQTQAWRYDRQLLKLLITPSWISGFFCMLTSTVTTVILLTQGQYEGSELQQQFFAWQQSGKNNSLSQVNAQLQYSKLGHALATIQVFAFWYVVGLILYVLATAALRALQGIQEVRRDLNYVNVTKRHVMLVVGLQVARQLGSLFAWLLWMVATLKLIIPYTFSGIQVANGYLPAPSAIAALIAATLGIALCLHIHIVLIRLFLGRPRIWHSETYIESLPRMN